MGKKKGNSKKKKASDTTFECPKTPGMNLATIAEVILKQNQLIRYLQVLFCSRAGILVASTLVKSLQF